MALLGDYYLRGRIYFHDKFGFHDGAIGKKFIILINNPQNKEPYLFVKTTSQKTNKPDVYGCHYLRKIFFIPSGKSFFSLDTWIQLHEVYEFEIDSVIKSGINKNLKHVAQLNEQLTNEIVNCLLKSSRDDLLQHQLDLIKKK